MVHFMGLCKYILSEHTDKEDKCYYMVEVQQEKRNPKPVAYNKAVYVHFKSTNQVFSFSTDGKLRVG